MRFGVLGTGMVGTTIATKLVELGHQVTMGARSADNESAVAWAQGAGDSGASGTFADAAAGAEMVLNCTAGGGTLSALEMAGPDNLEGKVLIDVSNPLDFSHGMPPRLSVVNDDSLGEQIQRAYPGTRVVKALNTVNCRVMVDPSLVPGDHDLFMCGNDDGAKASVVELLGGFGWSQDRVVDLADITGARAMEMYLPLWLRLMGVVGGPDFNVRVVR
ncbi:MAG: NAD(P)-binding domain-containing protein [Actinomycetota bacterium]|nr:NAD(P)-binding domain-containing protein [Actinomycetota bacterium]